MITLQKIGPSQASKVHALVHAGFLPLLNTYHDDALSPANKSPEYFEKRLAAPQRDAYFICLDASPIGYVDVNTRFAGVARLGDVCILPEHQGHGYASDALRALFALYPNVRALSLVTIAQEAPACGLYEKLGFSRLGEACVVNERVTLVHYFMPTAPALRIRPMRAEDQPAARELALETQRLHQQSRPDIYTQVDCEARDFTGELTDAPHSVTLVAELHGRVVGLCITQLRTSADNPLLVPRTFAFVDDLCVEVGHRGQGVGTCLMLAVMELARARGMQSVELNVWSFNESALRFYESLGMQSMRTQLELKL